MSDFATCTICFSEHTDPLDQVLHCAKCYVHAHDLCYHAAPTPVAASGWLCDKCLAGLHASSYPPCAICGLSLDVAYKQCTSGGGFVHALCAALHPDVSFRYEDTLKSPCDVSRLSRRSARSVCQDCLAGKADRFCSARRCRSSFHALCAVHARRLYYDPVLRVHFAFCKAHDTDAFAAAEIDAIAKATGVDGKEREALGKRVAAFFASRAEAFADDSEEQLELDLEEASINASASLAIALDEIAQETKYGVDVYHGRVEAKSEAEQERACSAILAHCAVASTTEEAVSEYPGLLFDMGHILPPAIVSAATGDEHDQQRAARVIRANVMYAAHHRDIEIPDSPSLAPAVYNTMDSMSLLTLGK